MQVKYNSNDEPREYKIRLERKPTNLGIGEMWFFRCFHTGKLCRNLYLIEGYFLHREALNSGFYEKRSKASTGGFLISVMGLISNMNH